MRLRNVITERVTKGSATGTIDYLESTTTRHHEILEVTHVSVQNTSNAYTRLVIGVADGPIFLEKEEQDAPAANNLYWTRSRFLIPPGKKLRAHLTGCTAGDYITMTYEGFIWEAH